MNWIYGLIIGAGVLAVARIYYSIQKARHTHPSIDFDEQLITRLRAEGMDPFRPHRVDFFLAMPDEPSARQLLSELEARGMPGDMHPTPDAADFPISVHVCRELHLTVDAIKGQAAALGDLARARGGRYDGWATSRAA